ncbi:hypothetical protein [uncultured Sphingobacterium sp.]|nr:hypothetical protein [uncultured Sphingobacterium sp.]
MEDSFSAGPSRRQLQGQIADKRSSGRGGGRPAAAPGQNGPGGRSR